tara:strand:+ start:52 stop:267 length:216 start_codon:yes stop_codon:yes gene_type:complete
MSQNEARYTIRSLFVTALATIIGTVLVLEVSGRINHSDNKDHTGRRLPGGPYKAGRDLPHVTQGLGASRSL